MIDTSDKAQAYGAGAAPLPTHSSQPRLDEEPAWKDAFRQTLSEIQEKGFRTYTDELQAKKMEELREKILEAMGFSEEDLENMPPSQREQIEKMVALEMQKRLAAENALEKDSDQSAAQTGDVASQVRATPNGLGTGILLMQELDQTPKPKEETG